MNYLETEYEKLIKEIENVEFQGDENEKKILQILYLDNYIQQNIIYDYSILEIEDARKNGDKQLEEKLLEKHRESYKPIGFFKNKMAVCGSISFVVNEILNGLNINSKSLDGHIIINGFAYGHRWNEIEINGKYYMYDFTHNMVNHTYDDKSKILPEPTSDVDYSFINKFPNERYLGGFIKDEQGRMITDPNYINGDMSNFNNDFSKYSQINKCYIQKLFNEIKKENTLIRKHR